MKLFGSPSSSQRASKQSRQQRLEVAKAAKENDRSRRRTFAFMKYSSSSEQRSSSSIRQAQEHARQLALAYREEDVDMPPPPAMDTPTSQQPLTAAFHDSTAAASATAFQEPLPSSSNMEDFFDPFHTNTTAAPSLASRHATQQARTTAILDEGSDYTGPDYSTAAAAYSTHLSIQDSYDTASVGSGFDVDPFLSSRQTPPLHTPGKKKKKKVKPTLEQFVERQSPRYQDRHHPPSHQQQRSVASLAAGQTLRQSSSNAWPAPQERSVISMPTIPSNSTMQAHYARTKSATTAVASSTASSGMSSGGGSSAKSAAARRRLRNQMRHTTSASSVSSQNSEVDSYASSTPPASPASNTNTKRLADAGSAGSFNRRGSNRLVHYQAGGGGSSSFYSQGSSVVSQHSSEHNLFDSNNDGGFTFDAFGLDESQVEREVNEAMQDLVGQVPGFSEFWSGTTATTATNSSFAASPNTSFSHMQTPTTPQDEFAPQNWDSPVGSRHSTPTPMVDDNEGFVDGFRITRTASASRKDSPQSDRSSVHSLDRSLDGSARVNLFKESSEYGSLSRNSARGNTSSSTANHRTPPPRPKYGNHNTPPRWESSKGFGGSKRNLEHSMPPPQLMNEPPSVTPWQEDPWASGTDDDFHSDFGNISDQGARSDTEILNSNNNNKQVTFSRAQSDVGVPSQKSVSFHANVGLTAQHEFSNGYMQNDGQPLDRYGRPINNDAYSESDYYAPSDYNSASDYGQSEVNYASSEFTADFGGSDYAQSDYAQSDYAPSEGGGGAASDFGGETFSKHGQFESEYPASQVSSNYRERQLYKSNFDGVKQNSSYDYDQYSSNFDAQPDSIPGFANFRSSRDEAGSTRVAQSGHGQSSDHHGMSDNQHYGYDDKGTGSDYAAQSDYGPMDSSHDVSREQAVNASHESSNSNYRARSYRKAQSDYGQSNGPSETGIDYQSDSGVVSSFAQAKSNYRNSYNQRGVESEDGGSSSQNNSNVATRQPGKVATPAWLAKARSANQNSSFVPKTAISVRSKYSRQSSAPSKLDETDRSYYQQDSAQSSKNEVADQSYDQYYASDQDQPPGDRHADYENDTSRTGGVQSDSQLDSDDTPSTDRSEEKKDDDSPSEVEKVGSLKAKFEKWESKKAFKQSTGTKKVEPKSFQKRMETATKLKTSLGEKMVTPDVVESRRQEARRSRTEELRKEAQESDVDQSRQPNTPQRSSFMSVRDRLRSNQMAVDTSSKSDGGAAVRSPAANHVLDRLRKESPRGGVTGDSRGTSSYQDTQSDVGARPAFGGVKLKKTQASPKAAGQAGEGSGEPDYNNVSTNMQNGRPMSYRARQAQNEKAQSEVDYGLEAQESVEEPEPEPEPEPKKLTYRERRELELKREQAEKAKVEQTKKPNVPPKRDVASLIRRRIAANKQKEAAASQSSIGSKDESDKVPQFRGMLKPVAKESPVQKEIPSQKWSSSPRNFNSSLGRQPSVDSNASDQPQEYDSSRRGVALSHGQVSSNANTPNRFFGRDEVNMTESGEENDNNLHQVVSPSSAETDMEYSTDNTTSLGGKLERERSSQPTLAYQKSTTNESRRLQSFVKERQDVKHSSSEMAESNTQDVEKESQQDEPEANVADVKNMLSNFLGGKLSLPPPKPQVAESSVDDAAEVLRLAKKQKERKDEPQPVEPEETASEEKFPESEASEAAPKDGRPALKDDPKYERYFRMLKVGMPMEVVKHAMQKDGNDPSVMDGDHNKPVGLPLKEDPKYKKYFTMMKFGISLDQVKHAMERDGLVPDVMDQDHNLPANTCELRSRKPKEKQTHRRARLHWKTLQKVRSNSLWAKLEKDPLLEQIDIDEEEFKELFQADIEPALSPKGLGANRKRGAAVRVIDAKRANNGGIILARLKMTHDDMAEAVDRMDGNTLSAEQIENIIEFLPTKEERKSLEAYMLEGGQDAAEKFDGLCECEKFMVSMMTVKHAKRKVRALLFRLQFLSCLESIVEETTCVETACDELSSSTRLRHLLGIVLQFGNRLNTAGAQGKGKAGAFTLDSLLKLNQAKAFDKKTTFLHYVVLIVRRNNESLLNFEDDLPTVVKADKVYWDQCLTDLEEVENQLENVRRISLHQARIQRELGSKRRNPREEDDDSLGDVSLTLEEEVEALRATPIGMFTLSAIKQVSSLRDKVEITKGKFHRLLEYFGEEDKKMQPHELFNIMSSFCRDFKKAKEQVYANIQKKIIEEKKKANKKARGKPSATRDSQPGSERPGMLKASNMQPNMSKVIDDMHRSAPNEKRQSSPRRKHDENRQTSEQPKGPSSPHLGNSPRNMHASTSANNSNDHPRQRTQDKRPNQQFSPSNTTPSAKISLRDKARARRNRHLQVSSGGDRATPVTSNTSMRSPRAKPSPQNAAVSPQHGGPNRFHDDHDDLIESYGSSESPSHASSPRASVRYRQRMEARKRHTPASTSPNNAVQWPVSSDVAAS